MDAKQILNASYLDILFEGKNKKYGGYELRKNYPKRAAIAGLIAILLVGGVFGAMLIKPRVKAETVVDDTPIVTEMQNLEPPPPLDKNEPPPPPPPATPAPVRPTVKFTVPEIKKDNEVIKEEKLTEKPEKGEEVGKTNVEGDNSADAIPPDLAGLGGERGGTGPAGGEEKGKGEDENEIKAIVDEKAEPGYDWNAYLSKNLNYPVQAREGEIQGKVTVKFVVEKDGKITNVKVIRGNELGNGIPEEAIRVVLAAKKWVPGKVNGKPVRSYFTMPIQFKLQ